MSRNCNKMKIIIKNTFVIELISISLHSLSNNNNMNNYSKKSLSTFKANVASIMANKKEVETKSEFTNVYFSELEKETEKAYLIDGKWYPKSACGMFLGSEKITGIEVKTWFVNK